MQGTDHGRSTGLPWILPRLGVHTRRIRSRLDLLGLGAGNSRLLWRGPLEWGERTRVHLN